MEEIVDDEAEVTDGDTSVNDPDYSPEPESVFPLNISEDCAAMEEDMVQKLSAVPLPTPFPKYF